MRVLEHSGASAGGGAAAGNTFDLFLASAATEQSSVVDAAFAARPKAAEITFDTEGVALVEYGVNLERWHDGNGVYVNPSIDDVPLRYPANFNAVSMQDFVFGDSASTWIFNALGDDGWEGSGAIAADKARELTVVRPVIVQAGSHAADVRFGINSSGEAKVRNVQLVVRVTPFTGISSS